MDAQSYRAEELFDEFMVTLLAEVRPISRLKGTAAWVPTRTRTAACCCKNLITAGLPPNTRLTWTKPGKTHGRSYPRVLGKFLRDIIYGLNPANFRLMGPDETLLQSSEQPFSK